jgi:hypothetical protein
MRKEEEKVRKVEEKLEKVVRENEDRWREREERMRVVEDRMEKESARMAGEVRRSKEQANNREEEIWESEILNTKERIVSLEERIRDGGKSTGKTDSEAHARIDEILKDIAKDRADRKEFEWNVEGEKGIQDAKESEKEMEKELEGAMEQVKILNLDFGKECVDGKTLVREAASRIREKVTESDKEDYEKIMRGARIDILGKSTSMKDVGTGKIHTVPVLITCGCKNAKSRLDGIVRNARLVASFQWPKECMEFVDKIREKVETMGYGKKEYYTRIRPVLVHGRVLLRVDTKRKVGGTFEGVAYWRAPPRDKECWKRIISMMAPEWLIAK